MLTNTIDAWYYWIEFLKLVKVDKWSPQVKKDFEGADKIPTVDFVVDRMEYLFSISDFVAKPLRVGETWDESSHIALLIDPNASENLITEWVMEYVLMARKDEPPKKGRQKFVPEKCRYPFCCEPNAEALKLLLYIDKIKRDNPDLNSWQLMTEVQKVEPILLNQKLKSDDTPAERVAKKKSLSVVGSRYLARIERIKAGVAEGIFPAP